MDRRFAGWKRRRTDDAPDDGLDPAAARRAKREALLNPKLRASGICGSGIIEAVAELVLAGFVGPNGRFVQVQHPRLRTGLGNGRGKAEFVLAWAHETSTGREIVVHSDDIRAIQLAKAALYAGAKLLMQRLGVTEFDRIALAGGFGSYIDPKHAMVLGMIPDCDLSKVIGSGQRGRRRRAHHAVGPQETRRGCMGGALGTLCGDSGRTDVSGGVHFCHQFSACTGPIPGGGRILSRRPAQTGRRIDASCGWRMRMENSSNCAPCRRGRDDEGSAVRFVGVADFGGAGRRQRQEDLATGGGRRAACTGRNLDRMRAAASRCCGWMRRARCTRCPGPGMNVRTRVHEYGGGAYVAQDGVVACCELR